MSNGLTVNDYSELLANANQPTSSGGDLDNSGVAEFNGQNVGYGAFFSNADFTDGDAGAGKDISKSFSLSADYIPVGNVISNLKEATMNIIHNETGLDDKIKKLRILTKTFTGSSIFNKLIPFFKPLEEHFDVNRMRAVLKKLERDDFNPSSQDIFRDTTLDISGSDINNLGIDIEQFNISLNTIAEEYSKSIETLFTAEKHLHNGLDMFDTIALKLDEFLNLETNGASVNMFDGFLKYLAAFFDEHDIYKEFTNYIKAYKKFATCHKLLRLSTVVVHEDERLPPMCSVCISEPVSHACVPGGHTFCGKCIQKQITVCFVCRTRYTSRMKLYFA